MVDTKNFFTTEQKLQIENAITAAELNTSGEIRVHLEDYCGENVFNYAVRLFHMLGMDQTQQKNGVLFYLAIKDKQFAIIGDEGINKVVPENFWESIKEHMHNQFISGNFTEGLCEGISMAGEKLKQFFPYTADDKNELKNEISF